MQIHKLKLKSEYYLRINIGNRVKMQTPAITLWFREQCLLGFFILKKQLASQDMSLVLLLCISFLYCTDLHPYNHYRFLNILRPFCASRNWWIIVVFLQRTLKEKLPIFLKHPLLLYIPLLALTDGQNYRQRNKYTRFSWAGGTFSPVVLLCQFSVLAGNRFWFYILLMYWGYHTVVVLC